MKRISEHLSLAMDKQELAKTIAENIDPLDSSIQSLVVTAIIFGWKAARKGWDLERTLKEGREL